MAQQVSDLTSRTSVAASLLQNPAADPVNPSIQTASYQGSGSLIFNAFCSCKTQRVRYSQRHWGPFLLEAEVRSRDHHAPECALSKLPASTRRTKRVLSLLVPTSERLWGRASRVSLSFTTGAGILGLGQTVAWTATVNKWSSPVFRLVDTISCYDSLPREDMHLLLASGFRRLIWCYANSHASVTDVTEDGDTIVGWALQRCGVCCFYPHIFLLPNSTYYREPTRLIPARPTTWQIYFRCLLSLLSHRPAHARPQSKLKQTQIC